MEEVVRVHLLKHSRLTLFILSLAVLIYAVPRLSIQWEGTLANWFSFIWLGFAMLVVAATCRAAFNVDEEEKKQMKRIQHLKTWQREQWIRGRTARYPRIDKRRVYERHM